MQLCRKEKMMDDLISREQAINRIKKQCEHLHPECDSRDQIGWFAYHICIGILEVLPSAESEIIRCKDCKHNYLDGIQVRFNRCELNHNKVHGDDWFCADAELRTEEE